MRRQLAAGQAGKLLGGILDGELTAYVRVHAGRVMEGDAAAQTDDELRWLFSRHLGEILGQVRHQELLRVRCVLVELAEHRRMAAVEGAELSVVGVKAV